MTTTPNPAWDPAVRWRVQHALDDVCRTAADVCRRHTNSTGGYEPPSEVAEGGDIHGLIGSANLQVLDRLEAVIASARREIDAARADVDAYQRARYGDAWQPVGVARRPPTGHARAT